MKKRTQEPKKEAPKTPKKRNTRSRRPAAKKSGGGLLWALIILLCVMGIGYFLTNKPSKPVQPSPGTAQTVTQQGTGDNDNKNLTSVTNDTDEEKRPAVQNDTKQQPSLPKNSVKKGKLAVVVDDCGYNNNALQKMVNLPVPMSFAVLPFLDGTPEAVRIVKKGDRLLLLHLPMEPLNGVKASAREIKVSMKDEEIRKFVREALLKVPGAKGVNNHQGSRVTSDRKTMKTVLEVLKEKRLFFLDSATSTNSIGDKLAGEMGMRKGRNHGFLDNSSEVADIKDQIRHAVKNAQKHGHLIVICHARPHTAQAWQEICKEIQEAGVQLVTLNELLN